MTSFDTYCFLTTIHMREAELEACEKPQQSATQMPIQTAANISGFSGDSAKGAKLFQVS